jgi:hypothetical protein
MNKFPSSKTLLDKSRLPLGILIHPYKDLSVSRFCFFFFLNKIKCMLSIFIHTIDVFSV